jgi:hypothetical protein
MKKEPRTPRQTPETAKDRQARLAAALKANIARRKDQAAAKGQAAGAPKADQGQEQ